VLRQNLCNPIRRRRTPECVVGLLYLCSAQGVGLCNSHSRVKTPDTDIFFILLHHAHRLTDLQVLFETGKGRSNCCIDITSTEISWYNLLNANSCVLQKDSLALLHALGPCFSTLLASVSTGYDNKSETALRMRTSQSP